MWTLLRHNIRYEQGKGETCSFGCHSFILRLFGPHGALAEGCVFSTCAERIALSHG